MLSSSHNSRRSARVAPRSLARLIAAAVSVLTALPAAMPTAARAADLTWNNGENNFLWDRTSINWSGAAWSNTAGNGAIFDGNATGTITLPGPIDVDSVFFQYNGYVLTGPGPLTFVAGASTEGTGVINIPAATSATIDSPIVSTVGLQKLGGGTLTLSAPLTLSGAIPLTFNGNLTANLLVGNNVSGGTLRLAAPAILPATTKVGIGGGYLDIGSNNQTLASLTFTSQNPPAVWNGDLNANNGVIGSGTLKVTGEINVIGVFGNNAGNTIAANVDLGGGTQIIRIGASSSFALNQALMFTGTVSNGAILKTVGYTIGGSFGSNDGISLYGNNTYTGPTVLNSGSSIATGTNLSTSIKVLGPGGPGGSSLTLQGENGSFLAATNIVAAAGASFVLDNNVTSAASGNNAPTVAAAQNNNRIRDDAAVELRDGNLAYRGQATVAATETFGSLNVSGGHNIVTITPNGTGGAATLTAAGNLSLAPRATLQIAGTTLGAAGKFIVSGARPTADATGILPRIVGSTDFLTYNNTTGFTPFTAYTTDFASSGTNVTLAAAATAPTVTINALRRTATSTLTIGAGNTLTVSSGMLLSTSGTATTTGGTLAVGAAPLTLFGTHTISSAITGTNGIIAASGTHILSGDLSGLSGPISINAASLSLSTNTFAGPLSVRSGTLNLTGSQTLSGAGAITLGVHENDANLIGTIPTLNFSAAGAGAVINRDIIIDNSASNAAGVPLSASLVTKFTPLSNSTGSQTLSGNITLLSPVNLQGGGGSGTGATIFTGAITGPATFIIPNGRQTFAATSSVSNTGGFLLGAGGFTAQTTFSGTTSGLVPITFNGGNNMTLSYSPGSLPAGTLTIQNAEDSTAPTLIPLATSSIGNAIVLNGDMIANVGQAITSTWTGPVSGASPLTKAGAGSLILTNTGSTFSGPITVSAGSFAASGALAGPLTVAAAGTLSAGNGVGSLSTGSLSLAGRLAADVSGTTAADLLFVTGTTTIAGAVLDLALTSARPGTFLLLANDAAEPIIGTFASITGLPSGFTATVNYAFADTDTLGRVGTGNDLAVVLTSTSLPGDYNNDGFVDAADYTVWADHFGQSGANLPGDGNNDGVVNAADYSVWADNFGRGTPPGGVSAVPEPTALAFAAPALALLTRRRR